MKKHAFAPLFFLVLLLHPTFSHAQTSESPNSLSEQNLNSTELLARGDELLDAENYEEAIIYYDAALKIDPFNVSALFSKGLALDNLGRLDEAISYYDKVLALDPNDVDTLYHKGFALDSLGRFSEAIIYYDRVLAINPNDTDALNNKNIAAGKQPVSTIGNILPSISRIINIQPDQTLLEIVGVFVSLLIIIIIINLAKNKRKGKTAGKTLVQTQPSEKNQFEDKEKEEKSDDETWKGI